MINKKSYILESDPKYVAQQIHSIIKIMVMRMPMDKRNPSFQNIRGRLDDFRVSAGHAPAKNAVRENRYASNAMPENIYDRLDHFNWTGKRQVLATGLG